MNAYKMFKHCASVSDRAQWHVTQSILLTARLRALQSQRHYMKFSVFWRSLDDAVLHKSTFYLVYLLNLGH